MKALSSQSTLCASCGYDESVFVIPSCRHAFHIGCIKTWPLKACPICVVDASNNKNHPAASLELQPLFIKSPSSNSTSKFRTGKWRAEEEAYINALIDHFLSTSIYCANGTSVRLVLASELHCSPMRLSKKFQKKALGKHTFRLPSSRVIRTTECCNVKELYYLKKKFRSSLSAEERDGVQNASMSFWYNQFLSFCKYLGQPVRGFDFIKKKKRARAAACSNNNLENDCATTIPWIRNSLSKSKKICRTERVESMRLSSNSDLSTLCSSSSTTSLASSCYSDDENDSLNSKQYNFNSLFGEKKDEQQPQNDDFMILPNTEITYTNNVKSHPLPMLQLSNNTKNDVQDYRYNLDYHHDDIYYTSSSTNNTSTAADWLLKEDDDTSSMMMMTTTEPDVSLYYTTDKPEQQQHLPTPSKFPSIGLFSDKELLDDLIPF